MRVYFAVSRKPCWPSKCTHGPQTWPWWRLVSFSLVRLGPIAPPSTGYAIWMYTRKGGRYLDIYFDRRAPGKAR